MGKEKCYIYRVMYILCLYCIRLIVINRMYIYREYIYNLTLTKQLVFKPYFYYVLTCILTYML